MLSSYSSMGTCWQYGLSRGRDASLEPNNTVTNKCLLAHDELLSPYAFDPNNDGSMCLMKNECRSQKIHESAHRHNGCRRWRGGRPSPGSCWTQILVGWWNLQLRWLLPSITTLDQLRKIIAMSDCECRWLYAIGKCGCECVRSSVLAIFPFWVKIITLEQVIFREQHKLAACMQCYPTIHTI